MERVILGQELPKNHLSLLKEKRLAEKKLREKKARAFSNLELPELDI